MIKTIAIERHAGWIADMGYEKRRYKKTGCLRNVNMEKNGKISWTEHNSKLRSDGNDWRRKSPGTGTKKERKEMEPRKRERKWNQGREKENGTKKQRKEMEPRKRQKI